MVPHPVLAKFGASKVQLVPAAPGQMQALETLTRPVVDLRRRQSLEEASLARRLTAEFSRNLSSSLAGAAPGAPKQLNGLTLAVDLLKKAISRAFRRDHGT